MKRKPQRRRITRRRRKKSIVLPVILIVVASLIFIVAGYKLITIMSSYKESDDYYKLIEETFTGDAEIVDADFNWDYDQLLALNQDAVGYIYQTGVMSYPILQAEDNDKYLRTMMNMEYNVAGSIFVDARFPEGMEGQYSIVYGHNMYNITMFGSLPDYENEEYYKEHPYFDIYIGYKHYRYYVFSSFVAEAEGFVYTFDFPNGDYLTQFNALRANGLYETDVRELTNDDHVIVLSTCVDWHDYDYRNVVCLVRGEEIIEENEQ